MRRLFFILAVMTAAAGALAQMPEPTPVPPKESIEAWRTRIESAVKAETSLMREIYKVESSEFTLLRDLQGLEGRLAELRRRSFMLEDENTALSGETQKLREKMRSSLRYTYKMTNRRNILRMLLRSDSIESFLRRWRAIKHITANDRVRLMSYQARLRMLAMTRRELDGDRRRIASLLVESRDKNQAIQTEREKRFYLLGQIQRDRSLAERTARDLESAREESQKDISNLTRETVQDRPQEIHSDLDFEVRKGYLKLPVKGPIAGFFGPVRNEQLGTVTRNNGIDILALEGAQVFAVSEGEVRFSGELKGFGRVVIIDHGNRYHTFYGHLERIFCQKGQTLRGGEAIGTVGSSGSLTGPRLHFEIRHKGIAFDPLPWIEPGRASF